MWEYTDKVKDHFLNPRNVGTIEDADGVGEVGSLACGDALTLYIKVDGKGIITDAKFQTFGCASAIASSSALTELLIGKPLEEAEKLTNKDIAEYLGGLPREKMHCSVMGQEALEQAIKNMRGEAPSKAEHSHEGELICECFGIFDEEILRAIKENDLQTVEDVTHFTKAGGGCGKCIDDLERLLAEAHGGTVCKTPSARPAFPAEGMTNIQRMHLIESVIDTDIRPKLQADGGNIQLVDIDRNSVLVKFMGMCSGCPSSQATLQNLVEATLKEKVDPELQVREG
ncbi:MULTISPECIES: Fe-S cluster assembly protein NifU [unclassified Pseudodesulfovibrio]|uniref:Fe-S cluster assembly protein NifU n=1 Tax=unclassified Pseudodesulfovibrio TaxID=2661612 RepID=UPI000FEB60F8|nr:MULTISPECIES: Fe-S cluster assembly protein NifU [unclassified Pseudodesulfovibrio]MCJ2163784.1 Fe-S cluster assembly protein NifU [Pseudodesulfovibrio sp. S3-i]RWU05967.1 Fe-S cluster assembly protein NifU [Pseudodesulfovibrio sp. S3]